jgi:hypothetical protein
MQRRAVEQIQEPCYRARIMATIDIPEELFRRLEAQSALEGRSVRSIVVELVERWLKRDLSAANGASAAWPRQPATSARGAERSPEERLEDLFRLGEELSRNAPPGPTATEILEADRNRLERP